MSGSTFTCSEVIAKMKNEDGDVWLDQEGICLVSDFLAALECERRDMRYQSIPDEHRQPVLAGAGR
jgi:hypothetical protein